MEGTHSTLQLHKPITELCYISFYLPRGEVRGFSYKGTVTLDRSSRGFHNCYQVREGPDIVSLSQEPSEHPGDIFFKQTPTKDILTELYKLTTERERLLADLLSSDHILGITMGNHEGKLPELSVSLAPEDDRCQSAGDWPGEPPVGPLNKRSAHRNKKARRFGGRREGFEALLQKRTRRKGRGGQESAPHGKEGRDQVGFSNSLPRSRARPNLWLLEERGNLLPNGALASSLHRRESCPPDISRTLDADLGFGDFGTASKDTGPGRGAPPTDGSSTGPGHGGVRERPRRPHGLEHRQAALPGSHQDPQKHPEAEREGTEKSAERTCEKKPVSKVVAKVQDLSCQVQRVVKTHPEAEERIAVCPAAQAEFAPTADSLCLPGAEAGGRGSRRRGPGPSQSSASQRASISTTSAGAEGAVNKVLLKVIESEKLDEATEGKRLGFPLSKRATRSLPETGGKKRGGLPPSGRKSLLLDLPHGVGPRSSQPVSDEKRPSPPAPAALGVAFNNSSPQSSTRRRASPVPSPLSPRLPSPQQHHRILRLPPLPGEREAALNDSPGRKSSVFSGSPFADTLEPPSSAKVTETKGASPASLRAGQPRLAPEETLEKSVGPERTTAQPQHQSPPAFHWDLQ
ncbi:formin-1 isoform X2 [Lemur catta]|uniref:formin-1 isoform X2 n=1 Tax=Lemur catta TaxID=9447 RepID=UPI001E26D16C|nr:formin-1 isoform X2 [Lemur catta]